jgi:RNA polymerase sigma factor (sigma-70 family)
VDELEQLDQISGMQPGLVPTSSGNVVSGSANPETSTDVVGKLPVSQNIYTSIQAAANKWNVPLQVALALAQQESGYNPFAHNNETGADGMMQFIPDTAKRYGLIPGETTRDPGKSSDAAMKMFSQLRDKYGENMAIKMYFGGTDPRNHGPKTERYLAEVLKRSADIGLLLQQQAPADLMQNPSSLGSLDSVQQAVDNGQLPRNQDIESLVITKKTPVIPKGKPGYLDQTVTDLKDSWDSLVDAFESKGNLLWNATGISAKIYERDPVTREELDKQMLVGGLPSYLMWKYGAGQILGRYAAKITIESSPEARSREVTRITNQRTEAEQYAEDQAQNPHLGTLPKEFVTNGLVSNFIKSIFNFGSPQPLDEDQRLSAARKITENPSKYPEEVVKVATAQIKSAEARADASVLEPVTSMVSALWNNPVSASKKYGIGFVNSVFADPEFLLAPGGVAGKVTSGSRLLRAVDAGITGAAITGASSTQYAETYGKILNPEEVLGNALISGVTSGAIGSIFKGKKATPEPSISGEVTISGLLPSPERFAAEHPLGYNLDETTKIPLYARNFDLTSPEVQRVFKQQINENLALSTLERTRTAENARDIAAENKAREQELKELAKRKAEDYDKALKAIYGTTDPVDLMDSSGFFDIAVHEANSAEVAYYASKASKFDNSAAVTNSLIRAASRDASRRIPKWQRGEVNPEILARLGLGGLAALTAGYLSEDDYKLENSLLSGLAALVFPFSLARGKIPGDRTGMIGAMDLFNGISAKSLDIARETKKAITRSENANPDNLSSLYGKIKNKTSTSIDERDFYEAAYPLVLKVARRKVRQFPGLDYDQVAVDSITQLFNSASAYTELGNIHGWITDITNKASSKAIDSYLAEKRGSSITDSLDRVLNDEEVTKDIPSFDTPETSEIARNFIAKIDDILRKLPDKYQSAFVNYYGKGHTLEEVAQILGIESTNPKASVKYLVDTAQKKILENLSEDGSKVVQDQIKKLRAGFAKTKQTGEISPEFLRYLKYSLGGASVAAFLKGISSEDEYGRKKVNLIPALVGAILGATIARSAGKGAGSFKNTVGEGIIPSSVRLKQASEQLWFRTAVRHELNIQQKPHVLYKLVKPLFEHLDKYPKDVKKSISMLFMSTMDPKVLRASLAKFNDPELLEYWNTWTKVQGAISQELSDSSLIKLKEGWNFPRSVKDPIALRSYLEASRKVSKEHGELWEYFNDIYQKAIDTGNRNLTPEEAAKILQQGIDNIGKTIKGTQPGILKSRFIQSITQDIIDFYDPVEISAARWIKSAIEQIELTKLFGKNLKLSQLRDKRGNGAGVFINVIDSISNLVNANSENLDLHQVEKIKDILTDRFTRKEPEFEFIQNIRNVTIAGLLGDFLTSAGQLTDASIQPIINGPLNSLKSAYLIFRKKGLTSAERLGLEDYGSQEMGSSLKSAAYARTVLKSVGFSKLDFVSKNMASLTPLVKFANWVKTAEGIKKLDNLYGKFLTKDEFSQLVSGLQKWEPNPVTDMIGFAEISKLQPVSKMELPQLYNRHPNGRLLYMLHTYQFKQLGFVVDELHNAWKSQNVTTRFKGILKTAAIIGTFGAANITWDKIRTFLFGIITGNPKDLSFSPRDLTNIMRVYGVDGYTLDLLTGLDKEEAATKSEELGIPIKPSEGDLGAALGKLVIPAPVNIGTAAYKLDPRALAIVPYVGKYGASYLRKKEKEQKEQNKSSKKHSIFRRKP